MQLSEQQLETIRNFCRQRAVVKAYVFGSYARGEANDNSDVDLLLELDYNRLDGLDYLGWRQQLRRRLKKKVDIVSDLKPRGYASAKLYERILADRQQVYEATS